MTLDYTFLKEGQDFISQVASFIGQTTMTGSRWAEDVATSLLSSVMGPERFISSIKGKLPLNIWYMVVGPSSLGHKTLPLKNYLVPILRKTQDILEYSLILPSKWSVEGLIEHLDEYSVGCMYREEFTSVFKEAYNKDYLADSLEFLSELYDGTIQKRSTIEHGVKHIKDIYVTFITASTPYLYKVMRSDFYVQGTGNRILVELFDVDDLPKAKTDPELFFRGPIFETRREAFIEEVAETLAKLRRSHIQYLIPDEDAGKIWSQFEYESRLTSINRFKENVYDLHYTYLSRMAEMALKLSALYTMSRVWDRAILEDAPAELIVLEKDMQRAIEKVKHHYNEFRRMLEQWRTQPEPARIATFEEQAQYLLDRLYEHIQGVSWTELHKSAKWDSRTWYEVLKYLHQSGKVVIAIQKSGEKGGRPSTLFYENKPSIVVTGKVLNDWRAITEWLDLR